MEFTIRQEGILCKIFGQKKYTNKLHNKIISMDLAILQRKINKAGYSLKLNWSLDK